MPEYTDFPGDNYGMAGVYDYGDRRPGLLRIDGVNGNVDITKQQLEFIKENF
jgi:hypothetical protein